MYARKIDTAWEVFAPAKLNLYLEVLGRRDDGFHELETLMAPIRLYDRLQWRPRSASQTGRFSLRYDCSTASTLIAAAPADRHNLIWRAVELLAETAGREPAGEITLTKRIPVQAGLGGGSSDAAAALVLVNRAWGVNYPVSRLQPLAAQLGSDVPFFLAGQSAICRGRGERVEPVAVPRLNVVVLAPPSGVSTAAAFQSLDEVDPTGPSAESSKHRLAKLLHNLGHGSLSAAGRSMTNRLQSAVARLHPWLERLGMAFASCSCHVHLLTGSGSAYFGLMRSARHARRAARLLSSASLGKVFATATCR